MKTVELFQKLPLLVEFARLKHLDFRVVEIYRSPKRQAALYEKGLSLCDGFSVLSPHQKAEAGDGYIFDSNGRIVENDDARYNKPYTMLHEFWRMIGGAPVVKWKKKGEWLYDWGHFE